jgi:MFS family permease
VREGVRLLLRSRDYWLISLGSFTRYGSFVAIQGLWIGPWLADVVGLGPVAAGNLILVLNVGLVIGAPAGGWLSDHVLRSRKRVALLCLGGLGVTELALALAGRSMAWWTLALVLAAFGVASSFAQVLYAHVKDVMPARMAGMAMTGTNFFVMLGAATYTHVMGWILDRTAAPGGARTAAGYETAFLIAGVTVLVSFVAYLGTRDARSAPAAAKFPSADSAGRQ